MRQASEVVVDVERRRRRQGPTSRSDGVSEQSRKPTRVTSSRSKTIAAGAPSNAARLLSAVALAALSRRRCEAPVMRAYFDETDQTWWFSVYYVLQVLYQAPTFMEGSERWKKIGSEYRIASIDPFLRRLRMTAEDGKSRLTLMGTAETLLRLIQTVRTPQSARIKDWIAQVAAERLHDMIDPSSARQRAGVMKKKLRGRSQGGNKSRKQMQYDLFMSLLDPCYGREAMSG